MLAWVTGLIGLLVSVQLAVVGGMFRLILTTRDQLQGQIDEGDTSIWHRLTELEDSKVRRCDIELIQSMIASIRTEMAETRQEGRNLVVQITQVQAQLSMIMGQRSK